MMITLSLTQVLDKMDVSSYYYAMTQSWKTKKAMNLFTAFSQLNTAAEVAAFCRDLMTEVEIAEFAARWEVAQQLDNGKSQRQVSADTGVSIATVTRVNQWLQRGMGGYKLALSRLTKSSHHHTDPELAAS